MASLKFHVYRGDNAGTVSCDFRGENKIGAPEDQHRTALEVDPVDERVLALALAEGPAVNAFFEAVKAEQPDVFAKIATVLGLDGDGPVGLRVGIWDE